MNFETILLERLEPGIRLITINRPKALNALSPQVLDELARAFIHVNAEGDARALLITGTHFSTDYIDRISNLALDRARANDVRTILDIDYRPVLWGLVSSMDLYVYTQQTARGELVVGAETLPYNTYSTRSTFEYTHTAMSLPSRPGQFQCGSTCSTGVVVHHDW